MDKIAAAAGGAGAAGLAVALWMTQGPDATWADGQVAVLGAGIGAGIGYLVSWLDLLKAVARRKLGLTDQPPAA